MTTGDGERSEDFVSHESTSLDHAATAHDDAIRTIDLPLEIGRLRHGRTYDNGGPSGRTLLKQPDLRIVLIALRSGGHMEEHSASGPCSIHAIEGRVRVHLASGPIELGRGGLLAMESAVRHDVEAVEDSAFLLTIGRTKYEHVSGSHESKP